MKISKIFHFLYFAVLSIPLVTIPIFAIYSQNHEINDNTLQVQENLVVDFNQVAFAKTTNTEITYVDDLTIYTANQPRTNSNIELTTNYPFIINHKILIKADLLEVSGTFTAWSLLFNWNSPWSNNTLFNQNSTATSFSDIVSRNNTNDGCVVRFLCFGSWSNDFKLKIRLQTFDLTKMYGLGHEPTLDVFNAQFSNAYYDPTYSQQVSIENTIVTYDDTDIMSQFMYCEYNFMDKYLGIYKYQPFSGIYSWIQNTFFNANAPLVFTIFYQWFAYWLLVSLFWLIFDVLIYVPMVAHRWLDKGALE